MVLCKKSRVNRTCGVPIHPFSAFLPELNSGAISRTCTVVSTFWLLKVRRNSSQTQTARDSITTEGQVMADPRPGPNSDRFEVRVTADTHFGWLRTRMSVERTLMSWVRTAVSLIGFGFTIVQFFDRMQGMPGVKTAQFPEAPRYLGLALIFCGIAALLISVWQYRWSLRYLWGGNFAAVAGVKEEGWQTPLIAVCIALILIGLFAFFAVLFRLV
jgi:putative membrane protein